MTCNTSAGLLIFYYIKIAANIIFIITPIILLIMCALDLFKAVTGDYSKGNALQKCWSNIVKRVIIAIVILVLPSLIGFVMSVTDIGTSSECFNKATKSNIEILEKQEEAARKAEEEKKKNSLIERIKKLNAEAKEKAEKERLAAAEKYKNNPNSTGYINIKNGASGDVTNALNIPYYNQCDKRWGDIQYDTGGATLCSSSCGYTSLAMIVSGLTGNSNINPYTIVKDIRKLSDGRMTSRGYGAASKSELTSSKYLSKYGVEATKISKKNIVSELRNNNPVIVLVPGHYIALSRSTNGNIVVLDPFSGWADKSKGSGEYTSIESVQSAYGSISWAASYRRV